MPPYKRKRTSFTDGLAAYKRMKMAPVAGAKVVASAALAKVNRIARKLVSEEEVKVVGVSTTLGTPLAVPTTGTWNLINQIAQGVTTNTRVGSKCTGKYVTFRWTAHHDTAAPYSRLRIMVIRCKQQDADAASFPISDLLGNAPDWVMSEPNATATATEKFDIMYDRLVVMDNLSRKTASGYFRKNINHKFAYNGANATDINKNGIYLFMIADQATTVPVVNLLAQCGFIDD